MSLRTRAPLFLRPSSAAPTGKRPLVSPRIRCCRRQLGSVARQRPQAQRPLTSPCAKAVSSVAVEECRSAYLGKAILPNQVNNRTAKGSRRSWNVVAGRKAMAFPRWYRPRGYRAFLPAKRAADNNARLLPRRDEEIKVLDPTRQGKVSTPTPSMEQVRAGLKLRLTQKLKIYSSLLLCQMCRPVAFSGRLEDSSKRYQCPQFA